MSRRLSLRTVLAAAILLPVLLSVGLVGSLSLWNGQRAVQQLVFDLQHEVSRSVEQRFASYLEIPHLVNQINVDALQGGQLDAGDTVALRRHFHDQMQLFGAASYLQLGRADGSFVGVERNADGSFNTEITDELGTGKGVYLLDATGEPTGELLDFVDGYDARERPWYRAAIAAGEPTWSEIYQFSSTDSVRLGITAVQPHYDAEGALVGVVGTDIVLSHLSSYLHEPRLGAGGRLFVIERDGQLVASSAMAQPFTVTSQGTAVRLAAVDSEDLLIRTAVQALIDNAGGLARVETQRDLIIDAGSERAFVHAMSFRDGRGLDWLVVLVLPEASFMTAIHENTRTTLWLALAVLMAALLLGSWLGRRVTDPVQQLDDAAQAISEGNWGRAVPTPQTRELFSLAQAFTRMRGDLRRTQTDLQSTIDQRTLAMRAAKRAQAQAEAGSRAKSTFLANMSHELRTPLNAILGYSELLAEEGTELTEEEIKADLERIHIAGGHLLDLIDQILDLSKIEAGHMDVDWKDVDIAALIHTVAETVRPLVEQGGNELVLRFSPQIGHLRTDNRKLRQILVNLLGNASKFTEGGTITLEADREEEEGSRGWMTFVVTDTGIGIPPDRIDSLFDAFSQVDASTTRQYGGAGLGLAIARQFVGILGGHIRVRSKWRVGTTFEVSLPVDSPEEGGKDPTARPTPGT